MNFSVAAGTESQEILFSIVTKIAPCANMVILEFGASSTVLALPTVTVEHLLPETSV